MSATKTETDRNYKTRKRRKAAFRLIIFIFIVLLTIICGYISYSYVMDGHKGSSVNATISINTENGIPIEIPLGSSTSDIAGILKDKGVIIRPDLFKIVSKINGYDGSYQSGTHLIDKSINYNSIEGYDKLMIILSSRPLDNPSIKITIPEGYAYSQIVSLLFNKKLIDKEKFNNIANTGDFSYKFLKRIPARENRLEGYLYPETYIFDIKGGEKEVLNKLLGQFDKVFLPEYYARAEEMNMSADEIITLASIIEREAKVPDERETIAGVFYNRLKSKDKTLRKLQSCATLQYILLQRDGKVKETITLEDEKIDNPYNTYMYEGLPPGPICSPGRDSILAALNPEQHGFYYFVLKEDGTGAHYFSKTYKEHLNAKAKAEKTKKAAQ